MNRFDCKTNEGKERITYFLIFVLALFLYVFFVPYYKLSNGDDVWRISLIHSIMTNGGVSYLQSFLPDIGGDYMLVSTIHAYIYGIFFSIFGWAERIGWTISSVIFFLSLVLWWRILKHLEFSKSFIISVIIVNYGNIFRYGQPKQNR